MTQRKCLEGVNRGSNDGRRNQGFIKLLAPIPWVAVPLGPKAPPLLPSPPLTPTYSAPPSESSLKVSVRRLLRNTAGDPSEAGKSKEREWVGKTKGTYFGILHLRRHLLLPAVGQGRWGGVGVEGCTQSPHFLAPQTSVSGELGRMGTD